MKSKAIILLTGLLILSILSFNNLIAQNIAITDSSIYVAKSSAMLDVCSSTKGLLIPRLDSAHRVDMASPAEGLLVFDSTKGAFFYYKIKLWVFQI